MTLPGLRGRTCGIRIAGRRAKLSARSSKAMATRVAARWCKFSPAAMSNGFVQRGGWWVVGQFLLLLAIAGLDLTGHATSKSLPHFLCGLVFLVASTICGLAGSLALGRNLTPFPKPSAKAAICPAWHLRFDSASALHFRFLCRRRVVAHLSKLAGLDRFLVLGFSSMPKPVTKNAGCGRNSRNTRVMSDA